jgi:hypothetical protein
MPDAPLMPHSPLQRQIVQMALDLAAQLEAKAGQAPRGQILADCEALLLDQGRQFLRDSLAATLQQQIEDAEKKGGPPGPVLVDRPAATRAPGPVNS